MPEVELTLSKTYTPPSPKTATKLVVSEVCLRITGKLVSEDGESVTEPYTFDANVKDDSDLRSQAIALAQAAMPERFGAP